MKYLYESHLGGYYFRNEYLENTHCEVCGDSDNFIGGFEDSEDLFYLIIEYLANNREYIDTSCFLKEIHNALEDDELYNETLNKIKKFALDLLKEVDGK